SRQGAGTTICDHAPACVVRHAEDSQGWFLSRREVSHTRCGREPLRQSPQVEAERGAETRLDRILEIDLSPIAAVQGVPRRTTVGALQRLEGTVGIPSPFSEPFSTTTGGASSSNAITTRTIAVRAG